MGLKDALTRLLNTRQDAVSPGSASKPNKELSNFVDQKYERIARTVINARYAYENDPTVNSSINNAVFTALAGMKIVADDPKHNKALEHIMMKWKDWDFEDFVEETGIKSLVDGTVYIQKAVENGSIKIHFLAYDGDKFDFKVIRDPLTEQIVGYKQKATVNRLEGDWESLEFDKIEGEEVEIETSFLPEEIINLNYMELDGEGRSAIYPAIDLVDMKKRVEEYMLKHAHQAGTILGIEIGADDYDISALDDNDIDEIIEYFTEKDKHEVVGYPAGLRPHTIGGNNLLDYTLYLKYLKAEIRSVLMTPDSKFESSKGSRFTAKEQMSGAAGFIIYIDYLRNFLRSYLEPELIDEELELAGFKDAIGHIKIQFPELDQDDETESAKIAERLKAIVPEADNEIIKQAYFKRYADLEAEMGVRLTNTADENSVEAELKRRGLVAVKRRVR